MPVTSSSAQSTEERLEALESAQSPKRLFTTAASVVALVVSLMTGGFTVYDRLVTQPHAATESRVQEFASALDQINAVTATFTQRYTLATTAAERAALQQSTSGQVGSLMGTAERLLVGIEDQVSARQYLMLASTYLNLYDMQNALRFADAALKRNPQPMEAENAYVLRGRTIPMIKGAAGVPEARASFDSAEQAMNGQTQYGVNFNRADLIVDRLMLETMFGDCARVPALYAGFVTARDASGIDPAMNGGWAGRLQSMQGMARGRCAMPPEAVTYVNNFLPQGPAPASTPATTMAALPAATVGTTPTAP